jgi:hypothetical protein
VNLTFPRGFGNVDAAEAESQIRFMGKAAQLPGSTVGIVPVYYFGREMKFAGNRTFTDWTVQIINDENFRIRNALERWMSAINSHAGNTRAAGARSPVSYTGSASVLQYGKTGPNSALKGYNFVGLFPVDIAPIDLDWGSNDTIEEYSVTFAYQYWQSNTTDFTNTTGTNTTAASTSAPAPAAAGGNVLTA